MPPDYPYPAGLDDCMKVWRATAETNIRKRWGSSAAPLVRETQPLPNTLKVYKCRACLAASNCTSNRYHGRAKNRCYRPGLKSLSLRRFQA
jgi:hypothetical protein